MLTCGRAKSRVNYSIHSLELLNIGSNNPSRNWTQSKLMHCPLCTQAPHRADAHAEAVADSCEKDIDPSQCVVDPFQLVDVRCVSRVGRRFGRGQFAATS